MRGALVRFALGRPRLVVVLSTLVTLVLAAQLPRIRIDTDPENMLPHDEPVRIAHDEIRARFALDDLVVVGILREGGVMNPATLTRVARITDAITAIDGVVADDVIAPSVVDDVFTGDDGALRVDLLMPGPPDTDEAAARILARIEDNPILAGKLASSDGKALALFVPIETKDVAREVSREIGEILERELAGGDERWHVAGIPLAEDTFGSEMFLQMGVAAPAAFGMIYLLLLVLFRSPRLVLGPMIVAMMSVLWTMGLLIAAGFTVHIMSSMIPVFLIPIAVLDSIHVLSELGDRREDGRSVRSALERSIDALFAPMLLTSITTMVGFASLLVTPIPPVRVFGAFVAFGIGAAWLLSMTFLPAFVVLLPDRAIPGRARPGPLRAVSRGLLAFATKARAPVVALAVLSVPVALVGVSRIEVNDNPVRWFRADHPLRMADKALNAHLAGTYVCYLSLSGTSPDALKEPDAMEFVAALQARLAAHPNVGATTSPADVVRKIARELGRDDDEIPSTREEIAQYLFLYEVAGGDPDDLWKLITPEGDAANIWVQMRAGENLAVTDVVRTAERFAADRPPPEGLTLAWAGLPYINIVWQEKMVTGMGKALAGSAGFVLMTMVLLFRSVRLGLLSMVPLTVTILSVYGAIGFIGKAYDMPIAVLSSLSLGLSIDFAIHFLERTRAAYARNGDIRSALATVVEGPSDAILRNVLVVTLGFTPMLFATLVPYVTVSVFFVAIMLASGLATLVLLPSILSLGRSRFVGRARVPLGVTAGILLSVVAGTSAAGEVDGPTNAREIVERSRLAHYYGGTDGRAIVEMSLTDARGRTRTRRFVMLRIDLEEGGRQKYFTYFLEPSDVRRTTFLVWKDPREDDARWIYVPAVDLVKRIAARDEHASFVGSDFSYEDVSGRHVDEDEHSLLREEELDGEPTWVIESVPLGNGPFSRRVTWISRSSLLPIREETYDARGALERVQEALEIAERDGYMTVVRRRMTNVRKEHSTTVAFSEIEYDVGLDEKIFSERYLKSPPLNLVAE